MPADSFFYAFEFIFAEMIDRLSLFIQDISFCHDFLYISPSELTNRELLFSLREEGFSASLLASLIET